MSEQNRYRIALNRKTRETEEWEGWKNRDYWRETADNWQDAIQEWLDIFWTAGRYTVISETPSEDGRSGINEIQFDAPYYYVSAKVKATLIEN